MGLKTQAILVFVIADLYLITDSQGDLRGEENSKTKRNTGEDTGGFHRLISSSDEV